MDTLGSRLSELAADGIRDVVAANGSGSAHLSNGHVLADGAVGSPGSSRVTPLSVIVPTRDESGNIAELMQRLRSVVPAGTEIIFVDDSDDFTPEVIQTFADRSDDVITIRLIHRPPEAREGGLGGAVVAGLRAATSNWACVMDGDLQHPPEMIPRLITQSQWKDADIVIASRYVGDGSAKGLAGIRTAVSRTATTVAQVAFPKQLRGVSDPMSGFFLVRIDRLNLDKLEPHGFKILLETLVKHPRLKTAEVSYTFGERLTGESKATLREGMRYLSHLSTLRLGSNGVRMAQFLLVGVTGILINTLVLAAAKGIVGLYILMAVFLATCASTVWNFALIDFWVFGDRPHTSRRIKRFGLFAIMNVLALSFRGPLILLLISMAGIHYLMANVISLATLSILRFVLSDAWIWGKSHDTEFGLPPFHYNVHGIVSVRSEVWLPELEKFHSKAPIERPTINVRIQQRRPRQASSGVTTFSYDERLGPFGFWADYTMGDTSELVASPLLRRSPHVLYTNLVEPLLRWTFVRHGYALVHGACIAFGSNAYLVTARTDTGKTTTILRILDRQRRATDTGAFMSDDLTLLSPGGRVLSYPKPLTISRHTVAAVNTPLLSRRARLGLFVQSRLHSRGGRRFALFMSTTHLPVATINAVVQWIVPPPKYHVQQLVPNCRRMHEARLAGMFVIERGSEFETLLEGQEALDILMANCDDAYGFPPYPRIRQHFFTDRGKDLQPVERQIVADALLGLPTRLMRSSSMDWSYRIPRLVAPDVPRVKIEQPATPSLPVPAIVTAANAPSAVAPSAVAQ